MGKRGPHPQPSNIIAMKGNPNKRPLRVDPIPPDSDMPTPPSFLDDYAIEEWNKVVDGLYAMKIVREIDDKILACYCDSVSLWRRCNEQLKIQALTNPRDALVEKTFNGNLIQNILVGMSNVAKRDVVKYAALLGIGAYARAQLGKVPDGAKKSKFDGLIKTKANK
jgi:P27 family predicted phage terminase small subunit